MELLFRKHFWTLELLFVALVALIVARTANFFIESKIAAPSPADVRTPPQRPRVQESLASLSIERLGAVSGLPIPQQPTKPSQRAVDPKTLARKSEMRVRLLGTLLATAPQWSVASVLDTSTNDSSTYLIGDRLQGAEVVEIQRRRVIILNNGRREFIDDQPANGPAIAKQAPIASPAAAASPVNTMAGASLGQGIRAISDDEYEVFKAEIDRALGDIYTVGMQARIVPAYKDGAAHGWKLFAIRPGSLYEKIGIQNGDVIKRINGFDLKSAETALEMYSRLKDSTRIDIEVERNGSLLRKTYHIR